MRLAKLATIWDGTLNALLLEVGPETEHYFSGYLYIKAAAAKIARLDPSLARPTTILPLLVRLICDHPVLEKPSFQPITAREVIEPVLRSVQDLTERDVRLISEMLRRDDVAENFDNWDIHAQLAAPQDHPPIMHTEQDPIFKDMLNNRLFQDLRGATSVHLVSWTAGVPADLTFTGGEAKLALSDVSHDTSVRILCYSCMRSVSSALDERSKDALKKFEDMFLSSLVRAHREKLTVAVGSYVTLTKGSAGMVIWVGDKLAGIIPLSLLDNRLDPMEVYVATAGLQLSPVFRSRFAHALRPTDTQAVARGETNDAIMLSLVTNPLWRPVALHCGLGCLLTSRLKPTLEEWCRRSLQPGGPYQLAGEVSAVLSAIFDRPALGAGDFADLLPDLSSLAKLLGVN
jgi:hypothetical protein